MKIYLMLFLLIFLTLSVHCPAQIKWAESELDKKFRGHNGEKITLRELKGADVLFLFLSPECPLCQNYTLTINKLQKSFPDLNMIAVFPGKTYSRNHISGFFDKYNLHINSIIDKDYFLSNKLKAEITPQVFLLDKNLNLIYEGAIDNWAPELGKKRDIITEHYLRDALRQRKDGEEINTNRTRAVGCKIQY